MMGKQRERRNRLIDARQALMASIAAIEALDEGDRQAVCRPYAYGEAHGGLHRLLANLDDHYLSTFGRATR